MARGVLLPMAVFAGEAAEIEVTATSAATPTTIAVPIFFMSGFFHVRFLGLAAYAAGIRTRSMTWMTPFPASTSA